MTKKEKGAPSRNAATPVSTGNKRKPARSTDEQSAPSARPPRTMRAVRPAREDINLGERLRAARKARGLSIEQVADASGITKSFLSRLERDAVAASVATLIRVCDAIGIRPGSLFDGPSTSLVRAGQGVPVSFGGEKMQEFLLSGTGNEHMMVLLSHIEPAGGSGSEPYKLSARSDLVHISEGELIVQVADQSYHLRAGDTLSFPPSLPHMWVNPSKTQRTVAFWVIVPPP